MRRIARLVLFASLAFYASTALASSTANMQLLGVSNNAGGVYTYPYDIAVNGTSMSLICDSYDRHIDVGETWQAQQYNFLNGINKGLYANQPNGLLDYKAAGLIFKAILADPSLANEGNYAIWGFFSANARATSYFQSSGAAALEQQYLTLAATDPNSAYRGLVLYVPITGTQSGNMPAQEFMGYNPTVTPEPATVTMCCTGLLSLLGVARRRLTKA